MICTTEPNIVQVIKLRRMRWVVYVAHTGECRGVYKVLKGKPEGKSPLGRLRRRWLDGSSGRVIGGHRLN